MAQFIISKSTPDMFEIVDGTKLTDTIFAHNTHSDYVHWHVSDIKSGLSIKARLPSLKACKEFVASIPEDIQKKIDDARQTERYKNTCKEVAEYAKEAVAEEKLSPKDAARYKTYNVDNLSATFDTLTSLFND